MVVDLSMTLCRMWCLQAMFRLRAHARARLWCVDERARNHALQPGLRHTAGRIALRRPAQYFGLFQCMHLRATVYGPTSFYHNDQHASTFSSVVRLNVVT